MKTEQQCHETKCIMHNKHLNYVPTIEDPSSSVIFPLNLLLKELCFLDNFQQKLFVTKYLKKILFQSKLEK